MPNQPKTPMRSFRLSDDLWGRLQAVATAEGRSVSEVLRELIEHHLAVRGDAAD